MHSFIFDLSYFKLMRKSLVILPIVKYLKITRLCDLFLFE